MSPRRAERRPDARAPRFYGWGSIARPRAARRAAAGATRTRSGPCCSPTGSRAARSCASRAGRWPLASGASWPRPCHEAHPDQADHRPHDAQPLCGRGAHGAAQSRRAGGAHARRTSTSSCTTTAWSRSPIDEPTDLVAITVETYTARRSYEIADEYRRRGVPVIMGGFQPTFAPEECAAACRLHLRRRRRDRLGAGDRRRAPRRARSRATAPRPAGRRPACSRGATSIEGKGYLPISLLQFSRGCRFVCDFCAVTKYFDKQALSARHRRDAGGGRVAAIIACCSSSTTTSPPTATALEGALPRAHPDAGQLGEPGLARRHLRPRDHAT